MRRATLIRRLPLPAAGILLLGGFALLYCLHPQLYAAILTGWGLEPFRFPFLDSHAVLSALECTRRGFDTYLLDPCDVMTRAFVYSPMILEAAVLPVTTAWDNWVGLALALLFLVTIASLPSPRRGREWAVMLLALFSTMSLYAVERGNIDLLILALLTLAGHLMQRNRLARTWGYGLILLGACLKYYPIVALVMALRESPRRFALVVAASAAILALFVVHYHHGLAEAMTRVPYGSYFTDLFGALNLPFGLAHLLSPVKTEIPGSAPLLAAFPWIVLVLVIASCARQAVIVASMAPLPLLTAPQATFLVLGATAIVCCFFAGQSIDYRGVYFLLLLPGLLALGRLPGSGRVFLRIAGMIVFLMWGEMFRQALAHLSFAKPPAEMALQIARVVFWFVRELIWWRVIAALGGIVLSFIAASDMARWATAQFMIVKRVPR